MGGERVLMALLMDLARGSPEGFNKAKAGRGDSPSYRGDRPGGGQLWWPAVEGRGNLLHQHPLSGAPHAELYYLDAPGSLQQSRVTKGANKPLLPPGIRLEGKPLGSNPGSAIN